MTMYRSFESESLRSWQREAGRERQCKGSHNLMLRSFRYVRQLTLVFIFAYRQRSPSPTPGAAPPRPPKKAELAGKPLPPDQQSLPLGQTIPTPNVMTQPDQIPTGGVQPPPTAVSMAMVPPSPAVSIAMTSPPPQPSASSLDDQLRELQRTQQLQLQQLGQPPSSMEPATSQAENIPPPAQAAPANQDVVTPAPVMNSEVLAPDANQALLDLQMLLQPPGEEITGLSEPIQPMRLDQSDSGENPSVQLPPGPQRPIKPLHLQSQTIASPSPPPQPVDSAVSSLPTPPAAMISPTQLVSPAQGDVLPSAQTEHALPSLNTGGLPQLGGVAPQEATPTISTAPADLASVVNGDQAVVQGFSEAAQSPLVPQNQPYKPMIPFIGEGEQTPLVQQHPQPLVDKEQLPPVQRDQPELLSFLTDMNSVIQPPSSGTVALAPSTPPAATGGGNIAPSVVPQQGGGNIPPSPPPPGVSGTDSTMTTNSISRPIPAPVQSPPPVQSIPPTRPFDDQLRGGPPPPPVSQPPAMAEQGGAIPPHSFPHVPQQQPTADVQSSIQQQQQFIQPSSEQEIPEHSSLASTNLSRGDQEQPATQTTLYPTPKDDSFVAPPPSEISHLHEAESHLDGSGTHAAHPMPMHVEEQPTAQILAQSTIHPAVSLPHPPSSLAELRSGSLPPSDFSLSHGIDTSLRDLPQPPTMPSFAPLTSLHTPLPGPASYTQDTTSHAHSSTGPSVIAKLELLLEQQKETIEKKTRDIEEGRAQIADQKRQLESYKQQVALLQQQLSQITAQQQKQEQEKVTVSGQQAVLMQLLQQQQGMFSQQQTQLESLSKVSETHHQQLQETEMKYRQAITVEQEQKASLQNQVLQLNQEIQRLHGQVQSHSQQQQNTQMQVYQYHTQIQERDKQLLAFRDQHKEIVQKLEQKHQEKVQQLIQQIQELQLSLKKSREQQRALQGGLPMPAGINQQQQFQRLPQAQQQPVPVQQLPQQLVQPPPQPSSQQPQLSQGPPQVPGTPTAMPPPPRQQPILQPSQPMPHTQQIASSTQQPLPPTSSGWPPGGLGRQGSSVYHSQPPVPPQQQMQPTQPQPPPMTPTSVSATTGNRPPAMIHQPPRTQPGQINTGTSPNYMYTLQFNDSLSYNIFIIL